MTGSEGLLGVVIEITDRLRTLQEVSRRGDIRHMSCRE